VRDLLRVKLTELDERMKKMRGFRRTLMHHLTACERELQQHGDAAACPVVIEITGIKAARKKSYEERKCCTRWWNGCGACRQPLLYRAGIVCAVGTWGVRRVRSVPLAQTVSLGSRGLDLSLWLYRAYFRREACALGEACATNTGSKASRLVLWVAAVGVLAFALSPYYVGYIAAAFTRNTQPAPAVASSIPAHASALETMTIEVTGMDCQSCEMPVKTALNKTPGVRSAEVSYERGNAQINYDPQQTDMNQIKRAIDSTGYKAK
jgi:copper chaperone CopZ